MERRHRRERSNRYWTADIPGGAILVRFDQAIYCPLSRVQALLQCTLNDHAANFGWNTRPSFDHWRVLELSPEKSRHYERGLL